MEEAQEHAKKIEEKHQQALKVQAAIKRKAEA